MSRYIDAKLIEPFIKREEWNTPDERWRPESEFGRFIDAIPTAEVQEIKRGRWIIDRKFGNDVMSDEQMVICSVCGKGIFWGKQNYCPNCGAKMDEENEDEL